MKFEKFSSIQKKEKEKNINNNIHHISKQRNIPIHIDITWAQKNYNNVRFVQRLKFRKFVFYLKKEKRKKGVATSWAENESQVLYLPDPTINHRLFRRLPGHFLRD